ncbi:adenosine receptor A1-like [Actinia tenebrosa]|uniref:Adenosine receptor A1-like n=1 Tax=Actinia tenebrosa TaxID=6105 RepID=A0A6P8HDC0_ACTTE|nr:adenosine receptor A1-like [Actinia tenebrosa]
MNNTTSRNPIKTNDTNISGHDPFYRTQVAIIAQTASLAVLGVIIVLGNLASIITFVKTQSLRRRCHYLIICLAVSDLLVGVVDFMSAYFFWTGPQWNTFLVVLEFMDTLTGIASVMTLSNIAIERFYAIFYPFRHRRLRFRVYVALCAFPWITATYISALYITSVYYSTSILKIYTYHTFSVASIALLVILCSYITIGVKLRNNNPSAQNQNRPSRDQKLAVTLLIVTLASMLTWLPLQCFLVVLYFCLSCPLPHFNLLFVMKFLQFCNSGINVFIYIVRMPEFRSAFLVLFCGKSEQNNRAQESTRMTSTASVINNGFVGNQNGSGNTCRNRSTAGPKNNSNLPSHAHNNLQKLQPESPYQFTNSSAQNDGARTHSSNSNPTNQNPRNCNTENQNAKESESCNIKQIYLTKEGDSLLDQSGYQQGVTNNACETEASGIEDSRL